MRQALAVLARSGVIPQAAVALGTSMPSAGNALRDAVLAEIPAFSASGNPEIMPALGQPAAGPRDRALLLGAHRESGHSPMVSVWPTYNIGNAYNPLTQLSLARYGGSR